MTRRQTLARAGVALAAMAWAAAPASAAQWRVPRDFRTIQAAIDSPRVADGDVILVGACRHSGAVVTKAVEIRGNGKAVIVDGPRRWPAVPEWEAGFYFPGKGQGSGASLVHLRFQHVDLPVFSAGADDVTVARCTLERPLQRITNWGGDEALEVPELCRHMAELVGKELTFVDSPFGIHHYRLDAARRTQLAGRCRVPWREGLRRMK